MMAKMPPPSSEEDNDPSISDKESQSVEYKAFIEFFSKLTAVFHDKNYLAHFVSAGIISPNDVDDMFKLPSNDRAVSLLKNISAALQCGEKQSFYKMLEIMQAHGNLPAQQLADHIKVFVRGGSVFTGTDVAIPTEGPSNTTNNVVSSSDIDFSDCDDIPSAFSLLTAEITKLLRRADFFTLRRAILQQRKVPKGVQFPDDLYQSIKTAQDLDTLLDLLADSQYWSWVDLRLLKTLTMSSGIREAKVLVNKYKDVIFSKKLSEVLDNMFMPQQKKHKDAYTSRVGSKIEKNPDEITVGDLSRFRTILEKVIMDINNGSCVLEHLGTGCLEIHWLIPTHCRFHAYKSALNNRHKFCDIHLQYLHIKPYPLIYDPFTIQPMILSTLLRLPKPIAATPAEVINHYYCFLADNLDNNVICQTMLKLEAITEGNLADSAQMHSDYQQNTFLLDKLLVTDRSVIVEFCCLLQSTKNEQEIGNMLMNAIESLPADDVDSATDAQSSSTPSQPTSSEEDNTDISPVYQPEVFLAAKTVHIRFLNIVTQLKQELKHCDPQTFIETLSKLSASAKTVSHLVLLPSDYLKDFNNANSEEPANKFAFLWKWNNHTVLRALVEACNCQDGIKMLDDFKSQINTTQPMELFPIPPPSMKMAPSLSSPFTVLSIRGEYDRDEPVPLQYVNDVATIMTEKFGISSHALQLLAARANPLMLYWMIPKSIIPLISRGVNEHLDFLKEKGFSEIAIYPNTILLTSDHLSHGSFALLNTQSPAIDVTEKDSFPEGVSPDDKDLDVKRVCTQSTLLKAEVTQLRSSEIQLSSELGRLKQSLSMKSTFNNADEKTMEQLEGLKIEEKPKFPSMKKHKDMRSVENLKPDLPPVDVRVKGLEAVVDELRSELAVKSAEMDKLKNKNKTLTNKYVQLKRKLNKNEEDPSQTTVLDSLEQDPENISTYFQEALADIYQVTCTPCDSLPSPMYYAHAASDDANVYVGGGVSPDKDTTQQVYRYSLKEDKWNVLPIPQQYYGIPQVIDGKLTLFGGRDMTSGKVTNRVATFHSDDNKWHSDYPDMLVPRTRPAVVAHQHDVIVAGGKDTSVVLDDIEVLNITECQWKKLSIHLPKPMWGISATASKRFFYIVGYNGVDDHCYKDGYMIALDYVSYNSTEQGSVKAQNPWISLPDAPVCYSALVPASSPPVIFGGEDKNGEVVATATIYEQATQLWQQVDPVKLPMGLAYTTVARAGRDAIIVVGGCTNTKTTNNASSTSLAKVIKIEFKPVV